MAPDVRRRRGHWERAPRSFEGEVQKVRTVRRHRHTLHHNVPLSSRKQNRGPVGAASSAASRCTSTATSGKSVAWWLSRPCLDVSWKTTRGSCAGSMPSQQTGTIRGWPRTSSWAARKTKDEIPLLQTKTFWPNSYQQRWTGASQRICGMWAFSQKLLDVVRFNLIP